MNHKDLDAWKEGMKLVELIYELTDKLPSSEMYGLKSQLKRASVSVPSNIAEGAARKSNKELIRFIYIAIGSLAEIETQVLLCKNIYKLEVEKELKHVEKCLQISLGLTRYLKTIIKKS